MATKIKKYAVIGGQYKYHCYGTTDSLQAAKVLATKSQEYWDNWQGWHTPRIYRGEDCFVHYDEYGRENIIPIVSIGGYRAAPAYVKDGRKWMPWSEGRWV